MMNATPRPDNSSVSEQPAISAFSVQKLLFGSKNINMAPSEYLLHAETHIQNYKLERLNEYAATLHVIGVLAGVVGTKEEQKNLRAAVVKAVEDYIESIQIIEDNEEKDSPYVAYIVHRDDDSMAIGLLLSDWFGYEGGKKQIEKALSLKHQAKRKGLRMQKRMVADFFRSVWNSLVDWWNDFWKTLDEEGLLIALGRLKVDTEFFIAECALDIALVAVLAGAGVAVASALKGLRFVGQSVGKTMTRVTIRAIPDNAKNHLGLKNLYHVDVLDSHIDPRITDKLYNEDTLIGNVLHPKQPDTANTTTIRGKGAGEPPPAGAKREVSTPTGEAYKLPDNVRQKLDGGYEVRDPATGKWVSPHQLDNNAKGQFGEALARFDMEAQGHRLVSREMEIGHSGIDAIYKNANPPPPYIISEVKYSENGGLGSLLSKTKDGRQMDPKWVRRNIGKATGGDIELMEQITKGEMPSRILQIVDENGKIRTIDLNTGIDLATGRKVLADKHLQELSWRRDGK